MYCGLSPKGRCMLVKDTKDISELCEVNHTTKQKRCRRKTVKVNPKKVNPKKVNPKKVNPKKICPSGKVLNPKTNRCIKETIKKPIKVTIKKKICPPGKILNPKTNRCIINRKLNPEKVIDFKYKCKPDEIYNPESKRCIKKDTPLGKKLMITKITDKIGGPISIHYYQFEFGGIMRHFLLFGDRHTQYVEHESPDIIEIPTLIKKLVRRSPHCIDLFTENPIYHDGRAMGKKLQKYNSPLSAVRREFGRCGMHNFTGEKCNYDNLRYQNWDLRIVHKKGAHRYNLDPYVGLFSDRETCINITDEFNMKDIILYFLGFTTKMKKNTEKKMDQFFDDILDKKLKNESFANAVADKSILQKNRNLIQKEYKKCIKINKFPKDLLDTFIANFIKNKKPDNRQGWLRRSEAFSFGLIFTDFYMLCRMFTSFDTNKKTPKRCPVKGENNYKNPQYSILYAGNNHVTHVITFFEKMFNVKPVYTTRHKFPGGVVNKLIGINHIKDKNGKKLKDISSVDDLFKDFY